MQDDYTSVLGEAKIEAKGQGISRAWRRGTELLAKIEHFCVGVQVHVFDWGTLNRLAVFYQTIRKLGAIIEQKRSGDDNMKPYDEFEAVVEKLKEKRKLN